jgi:pimeloyl-ACP methyl ester carboxylesterase
MMRSVFQRDGLDLSVVETGMGTPFVFQHGLCGAAAQPADVFPEGTGFSCLTLECRGHGASAAGDAAAFSIATFADDVAALISDRCEGPVIMGGISMGAAIALRLAVTRPELVRGLVLARPAWMADAAPDNIKPNGEVGDLLLRHPPDVARQAFAQSPTTRLLEREGPDNLASLNSFFTREPIAVTSALLRQISADGPGVTLEQIASIVVPTLVIGHGRDFVHPLGFARALAGLIPKTRLVEITPKADDPRAYRADFQSALTRFLMEF